MSKESEHGIYIKVAGAPTCTVTPCVLYRDGHGRRRKRAIVGYLPSNSAPITYNNSSFPLLVKSKEGTGRARPTSLVGLLCDSFECHQLERCSFFLSFLFLASLFIFRVFPSRLCLDANFDHRLLFCVLCLYDLFLSLYIILIVFFHLQICFAVTIVSPVLYLVEPFFLFLKRIRYPKMNRMTYKDITERFQEISNSSAINSSSHQWTIKVHFIVCYVHSLFSPSIEKQNKTKSRWMASFNNKKKKVER